MESVGATTTAPPSSPPVAPAVPPTDPDIANLLQHEAEIQVFFHQVRIWESSRRVAHGAAIAGGQALLKIKAQVPHGQWTAWLEAHIVARGGSIRTAQRFMFAAAGRVSKPKSATVADLNVATTIDPDDPANDREPDAAAVPAQMDLDLGPIYCDHGYPQASGECPQCCKHGFSPHRCPECKKYTSPYNSTTTGATASKPQRVTTKKKPATQQQQQSASEQAEDWIARLDRREERIKPAWIKPLSANSRAYGVVLDGAIELSTVTACDAFDITVFKPRLTTDDLRKMLAALEGAQ